MKSATSTSSPRGLWRRRPFWLAVAGVGLLLWTVVNYGCWWYFEPGLQAVPAFFLGALSLILIDSLIALVRGLHRPPWEALRWLVGRDAWLGFLWRFAFVISTVVLFYNLELWRGKHAWAAVQREAVSQGESLETNASIPPAVPDERNFAMAPLFEPLRAVIAERSDYVGEAQSRDLGPLTRVAAWDPSRRWPGTRRGADEARLETWREQETTDFRFWLRSWPGQTDRLPKAETAAIEKMNPTEAAAAVLARLQDYEADLEQLREYAVRPACRFPLDYDRQMWRDNPTVAVLNGYLHILRLRACALEALERDEEALQDIHLLLRLADLSRQQPWLNASEARLRCFIDSIQPLWEGLPTHRWSAAQLETVQRQLEALDLLDDYPTNVRNDAFAVADAIESILPTTRDGGRVPIAKRKDQEIQRWIHWVRIVYPSGWSLQDQAACHRYHLEVSSRQLNLDQRRVSKVRNGMEVLRRGSSDPLFPIFLVPKIREIAHWELALAPCAQTAVDQAATTCALERFRLDHGAYPESLSALVPRYLATLPHDIMVGKPLVYRRSGNGFVLYSVGGNGRDDGGQPAHSERGDPPSLTEGDWVWALTPPGRFLNGWPPSR